jgi:hypothetical protein
MTRRKWLQRVATASEAPPASAPFSASPAKLHPSVVQPAVVLLCQRQNWSSSLYAEAISCKIPRGEEIKILTMLVWANR